jgi:ArsR family transcriptional regulator
VQQRREAGSVVYAVNVPEVRDLLLAGRRILRQLIDDRDQLKRDLRPAGRSRA